MSKLCYLLPGLVAAVVISGCGEKKSVRYEPIEQDLCLALQVVCHDDTGQISCDPADGTCKCGGENHNGIACGPGEICKVDNSVSPPSPSCVSVLCDGVPCGLFEACDALDGVCKCGGEKCAPGTKCIQGSCVDNTLCEGVTCREGELCNPADGICSCGLGAEAGICSAGETCRPGEDGAYCVGRMCVGMNCPTNTVCSPSDGLCHCGGETGPACTSGQACVIDPETGEGSCVGASICENVICEGGTTCSPLDGECRCAGFTTSAPICGEGQTCDLLSGQCVGGDKCASVTCTSKLSCDAEFGICKCGGTGGVVCSETEGCIAGLDAPMCVTTCDPLAPNVAVERCGQVVGSGITKGCYFSPTDQLGFCSVAGSVGDLQECKNITDCSSNHHCVAGASGSVCRPYCDVTAVEGDPGACFGSDRVCRKLSGADPVNKNLGVCLSLSN